MTTWEKWWFFAALLNYQKVHKNSANCFDHSDLHLIFGGPSHLTFSEIPPPCHGHEGLAECYSTSIQTRTYVGVKHPRDEAIKDLPRDEKVVSNDIWQLTIQESDEWPQNQNPCPQWTQCSQRILATRGIDSHLFPTHLNLQLLSMRCLNWNPKSHGLSFLQIKFLQSNLREWSWC